MAIYTRVSIKKGNSMGEADTAGKTKQSMSVSSTWALWKVKVYGGPEKILTKDNTTKI